MSVDKEFYFIIVIFNLSVFIRKIYCFYIPTIFANILNIEVEVKLKLMGMQDLFYS